MVRLVYSNRIEELARELAARVRAQQRADGPLLPVPVVVASAGVQSYVELAVARAAGVAANLEVRLLTRFAAELLARAHGIRVADASDFEAMALTLFLDDEAVRAPDLEAVGAYISACGDALDPEDMRRIQLAARVGRLFEEYTYARGDMLRRWTAETGARSEGLESAFEATETWQRALWRAMFATGGLAESRAASGRLRVTPMHDAVRALANDPAHGTRSSPRRAIHVFAFPHVARTFHELFEFLGASGEVIVYALSPCEGFWEDVDPRDPEPLKLWARPGREQVRALNAMAGFDHEDRFVDPLGNASEGARSTLLRQIQSDILRRQVLPLLRPGTRAAADGSLAVLEHASARREVEAVASAMWQALENDPTLAFDDIALVVPGVDRELYATQVATVFREAHDLPYRASGLGGSGPSRIGELLGLLFGLPLGRFTRQELLRVALHPAMAGVSEASQLERWVGWCDALGIVHGADRSDHDGTYIARDSLNWDQGLRRLALGSFMAGDASGARAPFRLGDESYVPHEVPPSELRDAATFGRAMRSLLSDAAFARKAELPMADWSAFFRAVAETYVAPQNGAEQEELADMLRRLGELATMDLGERAVRYRVARDLASARVATSARPRRGEGVVVTTVAEARSLPFRVVFFCGMGEGRFPAVEGEDPQDLRSAARREGDVTPRERDRYAFLEILLGTTDRLVLSYVARDPVTGDALSPSSVVEELLHFVARAYAIDPQALRVRHPLRRWDPAYFPDLYPGARAERALDGAMALPEARAEARTSALRDDLETFLARSGAPFQERVRPTPEQVLARGASEPAWARLAAHLGLVRVPRTPPGGELRLSLPIFAITKFLEFPLQGWAKLRLGLDEAEDDESMAREDEPFETEARRETLFLRDVLLDAKATGRSLDVAYDAAVSERELRGAGPTGVFARGERGDHLGTLGMWRDEIQRGGVDIASLEVHRFGRAGEHSRADHVHDSLMIDVDYVDPAGVTRVVRADVGGRTLPLGRSGSLSLTLAKRLEQSDEWSRAGRMRAAVRTFVDWAVLSAAGVLPPHAHESLSVIKSPARPFVDSVRFRPLTQGEATAWLRTVARDIVSGPHAYFLPWEAVFVHRFGGAETLTASLDRARQKVGDEEGAPGLRSAYGPVPRCSDYPSPSEDDATSMVARRFGLFFAKMIDAPVESCAVEGEPSAEEEETR